MRIDELARRTISISMLRFLHRFYTYRELSSKLSIPPSMISRYLRGHTLPSMKHAELIIKLFTGDTNVKRYLARIISSEAIDDIVGDMEVLEILAFMLTERVREAGQIFDRVLVVNDLSSVIGLRVSQKLAIPLMIGFIPPLAPPGATTCVTIGQYISSLTLCLNIEGVGRLRRLSVLFIQPLTLPARYMPYVRERLLDLFGQVYVASPICRGGEANSGALCGLIVG
ncbi:hypothetical protein CF15_06265 [Pyrodictium occultum]|uniref:HTH cro/C1-type domain-containing protein n=1 Tax=Pyrodictium occultum TaxID=2309 RepID=A0A0V8RWB6_PYROC|nr:helix-turn-helix domain-containing protein [Pyrodictium occultum]KSW12341.1 hypothetical protein CF15_06265 [Pyrodictium occultum]